MSFSFLSTIARKTNPYTHVFNNKRDNVIAHKFNNSRYLYNHFIEQILMDHADYHNCDTRNSTDSLRDRIEIRLVDYLYEIVVMENPPPEFPPAELQFPDMI